MGRKLTFAGGIYDRTRALVDGSVRAEGIDLNWITMPYHEIWRRMLNHYEFDASELSLSSYLIARTLQRPLIAIPVFPARAFRHSYVFINKESGIKAPCDLTGKRVGISEFQQTATVWVRGILQHEYNVDLETIHWYTWAERSRMEIEVPARYKIQRIPSGKKPDEMLIGGELDAIIVPAIFPSLAKGAPKVSRLFEKYEEVEKAFYRKTGIFPIMHTVAMREELWRESPWVAVSLFKAFQEAKEIAYRLLTDLGPYKVSLIWLRNVVEEQREAVGDDPWPYGLSKNRTTLETLQSYLFEQGLIKKKLGLDQLFAPNTLDL